MGFLDDFLVKEGIVNSYGLSKQNNFVPTGLKETAAPNYTLGSPELAKYLELEQIKLSPDFQFAKRFSPTSSDVESPVAKLIGPDSWNPSQEYFEALKQYGGNVENLKALTDYQNFTTNWKQNQGIEKINSLTNIAQENPNSLYSFSTKEAPLYRGAVVDPDFIPGKGEEFKFAGDRFRSFSPDLITAWEFTKGISPVYNEKKQYDKLPDPKGTSTLFQVLQEPENKYNYLITPGQGETEVLGRPSARYEVADKKVFSNFGSRLSASPYDLNVVKLRQIYGLDPVTSAAVGGIDLLKQNASGAAFGAALSALNPDVAQAVEKNKYAQAGKTIAKDVSLGALSEAGLKTAGRYMPVLNKVLTPASRIAGPVAAGSALFMQGQPGSLTDVVTRKAAQNPVSWLPAVKANPQTDLGARASRAVGNEARYALQQLSRGKVPYIK